MFWGQVTEQVEFMNENKYIVNKKCNVFDWQLWYYTIIKIASGAGFLIPITGEILCM